MSITAARVVFDDIVSHGNEFVGPTRGYLPSQNGLLPVVFGLEYWGNDPETNSLYALIAMLDTFDRPHHFGSTRNLAPAFLVASLLVLSLGVAASRIKPAVQKPSEEPLDVTFVEKVEAEPPPPPKIKHMPPPPAAAPVVPDHLKKVVVDTPPPVKPLEAPVQVQKAPLAEADPSKDKGVIVAGNGEGDPAGLEGGSVNGKAGGVVRSEAPALPEAATAPVPSDDNLAPEYPEAAKSAGLTDLVILKIVIDEQGRVEDIKVMRGNPPFVEAALAAVKTWKYEPAHLAGNAIRVYRIIKIPFKLRT